MYFYSDRLILGFSSMTACQSPLELHAHRRATRAATGIFRRAWFDSGIPGGRRRRGTIASSRGGGACRQRTLEHFWSICVGRASRRATIHFC